MLSVWLFGGIGCAVGPTGAVGDTATAEAGETGTDLDTVDTDGPWTSTGCEADATGRADSFLFGDELLDVRLTLTDEAISRLAQEWDDDVEPVETTFTLGDTALVAGLSLRGGSGSFEPFDQKPAFKIHFDEFDPEARFVGLRALVLKNMSQDDAMIEEFAGLSLWAAMGVAAPRAGFARVHVNGELFGLYLVLEELDSQDFVDRCFTTTGGAFWEGAGVDFVSEDVSDFIVRLDGGLADADAPIRDAVAALDAAGPSGFDDAFAAIFDDESVLRTIAVELVTSNDDGYACYENNYYLYQRPEDDRLVMVGWGPDHGFRDAEFGLFGDWPGRLYEDCLASLACVARLEAAIAEATLLLEGPGWPAWLAAVAERTEADCLADPRSAEGAEGCADGRERVFEYIEERPAAVHAQLEAGP